MKLNDNAFIFGAVVGVALVAVVVVFSRNILIALMKFSFIVPFYD